MATQYRPGQRVPWSGQYRVLNQFGWYVGREVTCVRGEPFPPVPPGYRFVLTDPTRRWR